MGRYYAELTCDGLVLCAELYVTKTAATAIRAILISVVEIASGRQDTRLLGNGAVFLILGWLGWQDFYGLTTHVILGFQSITMETMDDKTSMTQRSIIHCCFVHVWMELIISIWCYSMECNAMNHTYSLMCIFVSDGQWYCWQKKYYCLVSVGTIPQRKHSTDNMDNIKHILASIRVVWIMHCYISMCVRCRWHYSIWTQSTVF